MAGYIGTQPVPQATQTRDAFTCTAGQTSFATSGYTPGFLDVYLNGIKLAAADYTASNGSDVVLASGAALDDILEVVAYTSFEVVTDTVTNAGTVLNLDRTGSDGTILDLKKDGTTVGSIGTGLSGGSEFGIKSNTGELQLASSYNSNTVTWDGSQLYPSASNDLGASSVKWRDLYLSGGVFLGGVGSANKLDDYEEGTWTPFFKTITGATYTKQAGYYTKVGDLVTFHMVLSWSAGTSINSDLGGLPFTVKGSLGMYPMCSVWNNAGVTYASGKTAPVAYPIVSTSDIYIEGLGSGVSPSAMTFATAGEFYVTGHYYANA